MLKIICFGPISIPFYLENSKSIHNLLDLQLPVVSIVKSGIKHHNPNNIYWHTA
jgi:hypothetical protein